MRTTITLDDQLFKETKAIAVATGRSFKEVVEDALRESFARRRINPKRERIVLPTSGRGGLMPGVDLHNTAALLDLLDNDAAP